MWYLLGGILLLVVVYLFVPTAARRTSAHFLAAQKALCRRNWPEFEQQIALSRDGAQSIKNVNHRDNALAQIELITIQSEYRQGMLDKAAARVPGAIDLINRAGAPDRAVQVATAHHLAGEIQTDLGELDAASQSFQLEARMGEATGEPALAIFALQRLADVLMEQGKMSEAQEAIERCIGFERDVIHRSLEKQGKDPATTTTISMTMPDMALASGDYSKAEKLFEEKVTYWERLVSRPDNIDVSRYQFHLATAQQHLGKLAEAVTTLQRACATAEREFGPQHPRTHRARRKLEQAEALVAAATEPGRP